MKKIFLFLAVLSLGFEVGAVFGWNRVSSGGDALQDLINAQKAMERSEEANPSEAIASLEGELLRLYRNFDRSHKSLSTDVKDYDRHKSNVLYYASEIKRVRGRQRELLRLLKLTNSAQHLPSGLPVLPPSPRPRFKDHVKDFFSDELDVARRVYQREKGVVRKSVSSKTG